MTFVSVFTRVFGAGAVGTHLREPRSTSRMLTPVLLAFAAVALGACQPRTDQEQALAGLQDSPVLRALKAHYPDDYQRLEDRILGLPAPHAPEDVERVVGEVVGEVMGRQRPKANPETALALYRVTRAEAEALRRIDPAECAAFMDGLDAPNLSRAITSEIRAQDLAAGSQLLEQTASHPAPPERALTEDETLALASGALPRLSDKDQDTAIRVLQEERSAQTPEEARAMCDFNLGLADVILAREDAGTVVRRLWALQ